MLEKSQIKVYVQTSKTIIKMSKQKKNKSLLVSLMKALPFNYETTNVSIINEAQ